MKTTTKATVSELIKSAVKSLDALSQHPEIADNSTVENAINLILALRTQVNYE
ncbi:MAG: hypothetical protein RLZZ184_87 [Cyanobacteriota bacterium]|jgi:hypothetical protein